MRHGVSAMVFNVGRMVGPAIAGILLVYVSEAWCFVLNALSYAAIIGALLAMRLPRTFALAATGPQPEGFRANLSVLMSFPAVRYLLPTVVAIGLFATPYVPLMPSIVAHFFDGQSSTVGLLMSAAGGESARIGDLPGPAAALWPANSAAHDRSAGRRPRAYRLRVVARAPTFFPAPDGAGCGSADSVNATNALLQQSVPDAWRGRVIGLYSMLFAGTAPIGGLLAGSLAERIGLTAAYTTTAPSSSLPACSRAGGSTITPRRCAAHRSLGR